MMVLQKLSVILSLLLISACASTTETIVQTKIVPANIEIQSRPAPVDLLDVKWYVVSDNNLEQFLKDFKNDNGEVVFVATSIRGYENLSLNTAELTRFVKQQKELIVYYETSIRNTRTEE